MYGDYMVMNGFATLSSDYCTALDLEEMSSSRQRKNNMFDDGWKNDFISLAEDFDLKPMMIAKIIKSVIDSAKPSDKDENLYTRAMNKLYDLI